MSMCHLDLALVAIVAFALSGCASTPHHRHAKYRHLLGKYDAGKMAMLDANNQVLSMKELMLTALRQAFAENGDKYLEEHPGATKQELMRKASASIEAGLKSHDPMRRMLDSVRDSLNEKLDGEPLLTLSDASIRSLKSLLVAESIDDNLVSVMNPTYHLRGDHGNRTLLAFGIYKGKPVRLKLRILEHGRMFIDLLPLLVRKKGKMPRLKRLGVDKITLFLNRRR